MLNLIVALLWAIALQFGISTDQFTTLVEDADAAGVVASLGESSDHDLIVTNSGWVYSDVYSKKVTAFATVRNNTGQTVGDWEARLKCVDVNGVQVAADTLSYSLPALAAGEAARIEFVDYVATGEPVACDLEFSAMLDLSWSATPTAAATPAATPSPTPAPIVGP